MSFYTILSNMSFLTTDRGAPPCPLPLAGTVRGQRKANKLRRALGPELQVANETGRELTSLRVPLTPWSWGLSPKRVRDIVCHLRPSQQTQPPRSVVKGAFNGMEQMLMMFCPNSYIL